MQNAQHSPCCPQRVRPTARQIPSPDEAEEIAIRRDQSIDSNRILERSAPPRLAPSIGRRSLAGLYRGSGRSAGGSTGATADSATEAESIEAGVGTDAVESSGDARKTIDPAVLAAAREATDADQDEDAAPTPSEEDIVKVAPVSAADFSQKVHQLGQLLGSAERGDEAVWQLFLNPERLLEERQGLAAALITAESPANQAYRLIKGATQFIGLKHLLQLDHLPQRNRRFTSQISGFINIAQAAHKNFLPNDRQLEGLDIILDHTANALLRLENLRINRHYAQEHPDHYTAEAVTAYREKALAAVQNFVDSESLEIARTQAEDETAPMATSSAPNTTSPIAAPTPSNSNKAGTPSRSKNSPPPFWKLPSNSLSPSPPNPSQSRCLPTCKPTTNSAIFFNAPVTTSINRLGRSFRNGTSRRK